MRELPPRLLTSLPAPPSAFARVDPLRGPFHADGLGSIGRLADEAGTITDGYTYSAFGELLAHTGSDPQPYAFTGEPLDTNSGWQYHRARWMDPGIGRFTASDAFDGWVLETSTLHRYNYASGNPLASVDPSGFVPVQLDVGQAAHRAISSYCERLGAIVDSGPRRTLGGFVPVGR